MDKSKIWVVMASGPSLGWDEYADVKTIERLKLNTIAVNTTWRKAKFCNVIYGGDTIWWKHEHDKIEKDQIDAERWTCSKSAMRLYNCKYRNRKVKPGYNSGANAIELAANVFEAETVILLGFDCSLKYGSHHHGDHKKTPNPNHRRMPQWVRQFRSLKEVCKGTKLINCSRYTEIDFIKQKPLDETLCALGLT